MKMLIKTLLALTLFAFSASTAFGGCGIKSGSVNILSNDFPAIHAVLAGAKECAGGGVEFKSNSTKDHKDLMVPALKSNPAQYTSVVVANGTLVPLLNEDLIRPLDDLVKKYGKDLGKSQLITINGKIMAIAFMANSQHLFYRADILRKAGAKTPNTYEDILAAAKLIKDKKLMEYPLSGTYQAGWNLGEEFVNMYFGYGGSLFKAGTPEPAINNPKGVAALKMMKALSEYMNPDFLTFDSNAVQAQWESGKVAITNLWGSRYGAIMDDTGSTQEIVKNTKIAYAPYVGGENIPATTLWWDGFTISKNISDADAEATFLALMNGISSKVANANPDDAVWIIPGYKASAAGKGTIDSAKRKASPYPMVPYIGLMHNALGKELVDFLQGKESAEKSLSDAEEAYKTAAKEGGFL